MKRYGIYIAMGLVNDKRTTHNYNHMFSITFLMIERSKSSYAKAKYLCFKTVAT